MLARKLFTVEDYHRMGEAGILHEDDRVELIEGEIVEMTPIGNRHASSVRKLNQLLSKQVGDEFFVDVQNPISLDERNEPQPDLMIIRARDYRESLPTPEDALLLIEVSDTTLAYDKDVKLPLYARSGVWDVWIVDIGGETIERHTEPSGEIYRHTEKARREEKLESVALPSMAISVDAVLG